MVTNASLDGAKMVVHEKKKETEREREEREGVREGVRGRGAESWRGVNAQAQRDIHKFTCQLQHPPADANYPIDRQAEAHTHKWHHAQTDRHTFRLCKNYFGLKGVRSRLLSMISICQ